MIRSLTILCAYTALSIIFTYPVAFEAARIPGEGDAFWYVWDFWWFKEAIMSLSSPYYTDRLFYPVGVSLVFSEVTPLNAIASVPLQIALGLTGAYNIIWIATFALSGYGAYSLVRYLTGDEKAALIAGLIFMFSPYRTAHALGHMNLISTEWLPLYALYLIRTTREEGMTNPLMASLFFILNAMSSSYYILYSSAFALIYLIYHRAFGEGLTAHAWRRLAVFGAASAVVISPLVYMMAKEMVSSRASYMYGGQFSMYSADMLGFFIPSSLHPLFGGWTEPIYENFTGGIAESTTFIGYTVILLVLVALIRVRSGDVRFWALSSAIFAVLCLGPVLHVNGATSFTALGMNLSVPLPYALLERLPVISMARVPSRWDALLMLTLAVLAGYGLRYIFSSLRGRAGAASLVLAMLVLFEFLAAPYPMTGAEIPGYYGEIMNDSEEYAILEVPAMPVMPPELMFYQTGHGRHLAGGYVSRLPNSVAEFFYSKPVFSQLAYEDSICDEILGQDSAEISRSLLRYYGIRRVLLHEEFNDYEFIGDEKAGFYRSFLSRCFDAEPERHGQTTIYRIDEAPMRPFITPASGWYRFENWTGVNPMIWMRDEAVLLACSDEDRSVKLEICAESFLMPRTLEIYLGDLLLVRSAVAVSPTTMSEEIRLSKGANLLRFHVPEGCDRPMDVPGLDSNDYRCLSLAFHKLTVNWTGEES